MKKLLLLLLLLPSLAFDSTYACKGYVVGFKGKDGVYDRQAFIEYANLVGYCPYIYNFYEVEDAVYFLSLIKVPYELYGYSQGAVAVRDVLSRKFLKKPRGVLTVGAYKTTNVNFDEFNVKYVNIFDQSGIGNPGPGITLNVPHDKIMKEANRYLFSRPSRHTIQVNGK